MLEVNAFLRGSTIVRLQYPPDGILSELNRFAKSRSIKIYDPRESDDHH
jgi:hypothetical protein